MVCISHVSYDMRHVSYHMGHVSYDMSHVSHDMSQFVCMNGVHNLHHISVSVYGIRVGPTLVSLIL